MQRILVTGAGARLGQRIALAFAKTGAHILIHYNRSKAGAEHTLQDIKTAGGSAELVQADLSDTSQTLRLLDQINQRSGPIHGLVNNASRFEPDHLQDLTDSGWDKHFAINVKAPVLLSQKFAAQLPANTKGNIVNLLDQRLQKLSPDFFSYTLSKAALCTATKTMAQALAPCIRVNAVAPGPTLRNARQSQEDFTAQQSATLLGAGSAPDDVVAAVLFLFENGSTTGQTITVDGGQHMLWRTADIDGLSE